MAHRQRQLRQAVSGEARKPKSAGVHIRLVLQPRDRQLHVALMFVENQPFKDESLGGEWFGRLAFDIRHDVPVRGQVLCTDSHRYGPQDADNEWEALRHRRGIEARLHPERQILRPLVVTRSERQKARDVLPVSRNDARSVTLIASGEIAGNGEWVAGTRRGGVPDVQPQLARAARDSRARRVADRDDPKPHGVRPGIKACRQRCLSSRNGGGGGQCQRDAKSGQTPAKPMCVHAR